jgi:hypothetical protein
MFAIIEPPLDDYASLPVFQAKGSAFPHECMNGPESDTLMPFQNCSMSSAALEPRCWSHFMDTAVSLAVSLLMA